MVKNNQTPNLNALCLIEELELDKRVDKNGNIRYYNAKGQLHRKCGPAVEYTDGTKSWWINGKQHREDGPAVEYINGDKERWINGKLQPRSKS